jgi:hypothetical protein
VPEFPAQCPACGAIFPFRGIGVSESGRATIGIGSDVTTPCPNCGSPHARISEGLYSANSTAIEIISAPQSTHAALEVLKAIAERAAAGKISKDEAINEARRLDPNYGPLLERYYNLGMPAILLLAALLGTYIAHRDSVSSSEDMKRLLNAVTEQTFVLKETQRQLQTTPPHRQLQKEERRSKKSAAKNKPSAIANAVWAGTLTPKPENKSA